MEFHSCVLCLEINVNPRLYVSHHLFPHPRLIYFPSLGYLVGIFTVRRVCSVCTSPTSDDHLVQRAVRFVAPPRHFATLSEIEPSLWQIAVSFGTGLRRLATTTSSGFCPPMSVPVLPSSPPFAPRPPRLVVVIAAPVLGPPTSMVRPNCEGLHQLVGTRN